MSMADSKIKCGLRWPLLLKSAAFDIWNTGSTPTNLWAVWLH